MPTCLQVALLPAVLFGGTFPALSHAQEEAVSAASDQAVVVGVLSGKSFDARLTKSLTEHLERTGQVNVSSVKLTSKERACVDEECLLQISARRESRYLFRASILGLSANAYRLSMGLFDAARRVPFQEDWVCDQCSFEQLVAHLLDGADRLLGRAMSDGNRPTAQPSQVPEMTPDATQETPNGQGYEQTSPPVENRRNGSLPPVSGAPALVLPPTRPLAPAQPEREPEPAFRTPRAELTQVPDVRQRNSDRPFVPFPTSSRSTPSHLGGIGRGQKAVVGVFAGLTVLSLGAAITLNILDKRETSWNCPQGAPMGCVFDFHLAFSGLYAGAGASLVGLGFSLIWPVGNEKKHSSFRATAWVPMGQPGVYTEVH